MASGDDELEIVEVDLPGGGREVRLLGELDMIGAPEVEARLKQLADEGRDVRLDLSGLTFMDSTGVRVLFSAVRDRPEDAPKLELTRPQPDVWRVIELTGLQRVLPFVD